MRKYLPLALDVVVLILLTLMVRYQLISATYHELAGIVLCGLLLIHFALQWPWIKSRLRRFSSTGALDRIRLALDLLMLLTVVLLGVSGVLISRALYLWEVRPVGYWVTLAHPHLGALLMGCAVLHLILAWPRLKKMLRGLAS